MDRSKTDQYTVPGWLCRKNALQMTEAQKAAYRRKRNLRRMYMASVFTILMCLTMSVSTTYAWFYANMKSSESVIRVANFRATMNLSPVSSIEPNVIMMDAETAEQFPPQTYSLRAPAMPAAVPFITEEELKDALAIPEDAYAAGTYQMNIDYSGTTGGYCAFTVTPASLWSTTTESATYYVRLGATDGNRQTTTVSLTLNEPAYVDVYSDWGTPQELAAEFVDETEVSFGEVLMIKVITADRGDSVYGVEEDTDIIYGITDDTTIIGGQPAGDGEASENDGPVYSVEDDTSILAPNSREEPSGPGSTGGEVPSDKASGEDLVYSIAGDTKLILLPKRKDGS